MDDTNSVNAVYDEIILDRMKKVQNYLLSFIDTEEDIEESYQLITDIIVNEKIYENIQEFKLMLTLITRISNNHHRYVNFFPKIEKIILDIKAEIVQNFSNSEIFDIFKSNKRILLFLIESQILIFDDYVCKQLIKEKFIITKYPQFFSPELQPFIKNDWFPPNNANNNWINEINTDLPDNFYENRKIGENDSYICKLIQCDMITEFQSYIQTNQISFDEIINLSIYETNLFLIKNSIVSKLNFINYAAFFGSFKIFKFLQKSGAKITPESWLFAIHGNNFEIIHLLEEKRIKPDDKTFKQSFIESVKCHHNELASYIEKNYFNKKKVIDQNTLHQIFKYNNFAFISEDNIGSYKIFDFSMCDEIFDDFSIKKKRGRPKGKQYLDKGDNAKAKARKKKDNNIRMRQLENPILEPSTHKTFMITMPMRNSLSQEDINSLHDSAIENEMSECWSRFDIEGKFVGTNNEVTESSSDVNDIKDTITIANLESHEPFQNEFMVQTILAKANKGYRLMKIETKDPSRLGFKCKSQGCFYTANFIRSEDGFHLENQTYHTCPKPVIVSTESLQKVIFENGKSSQLDAKYMAKINSKFNLLPNTINNLRIRRNYNIVFNLTREDRLASWGKLTSLIHIIRQAGGNGYLHKNNEGLIDFVGIVPNYALQFIYASIFFPVVQTDTRFQNGISKGHLYTLVTMTGDRNILPLAVAWAPSEKGDYTDLFLSLLRGHLHRIETCHTDDSRALIGSIEKVGINNLLCAWHISQHCPSKEEFLSLVKSQSPQEYNSKKNAINQSNNELKKYLDTGNKWSKISRFETDAKGDQSLSSSAVESLNAKIKRLDLKNKEPLEIFQQIYDIGFTTLQDICSQSGTLTNSAQSYLSYALAIAQHLTVFQTPVSQYKYEVFKDATEKCTVIICPDEAPICLCKFYHDTGMVCIHLLAVACQFKIDWSKWIHPRYFVSYYKSIFQHHIIYPNFDGIVQMNNDIPIGVTSLKQQRNRIDQFGNITSTHKH